jgi:hypothetical protein
VVLVGVQGPKYIVNGLHDGTADAVEPPGRPLSGADEVVDKDIDGAKWARQMAQ